MYEGELMLLFPFNSNKICPRCTSLSQTLTIFQTELASQEEDLGAVPCRFHTLLPALTYYGTPIGRMWAPVALETKEREGWGRKQEHLEDPTARELDKSAQRSKARACIYTVSCRGLRAHLVLQGSSLGCIPFPRDLNLCCNEALPR